MSGGEVDGGRRRTRPLTGLISAVVLALPALIHALTTISSVKMLRILCEDFHQTL
jgi:hypothetical protein